MTNKEAYDTAFYFILKWYEITKSDDIGELLSLMECLDDGKPADSAMWDYWEEAFEKVKNEGSPPAKKLVK